MPYFLAIDAGGTKTDYLLADETRELARTRSGTIKRMRTDASSAAAHLDRALKDLTERTGISLRAITRTCIGTAGETVPLVTSWLRAAFTLRVSGELILLGDVEIALDAAFPGLPGVLVLAGTGSNVAGRNAQGEIFTAGGWGPNLADQGSGHRIGLSALRAAFLAIDEQRPSILLDAILNHWQLGSIHHLVEFANAIPAPDFSQLVPLVHQAAQQRDELAVSVLRNEGEQLGYLARLLLRRLAATSPEPPPLAFAGSIMQHVPPVRASLIADVEREFPGIGAREGVVDPIAGALWRARLPA
jgi:N-acetylglucosamine kinase-like BadF-type ATPase